MKKNASLESLTSILGKLKRLLPEFFARHGTALESVFLKYTRALEDNPFDNADLHILMAWKSELPAAEDLIEEIIESIEEAYHRRVEILKSTPLYGIKQLLAWDEELTSFNPASNIDSIKLKIAKAAHDLYWDFHSPFATQINFNGFIAMFRERKDAEIAGDVLLLESLQGFISSWARGVEWQRMLQTSYGAELLSHKAEYLRKQRAKNRQERTILIVGGGPGGLMRALAALVKGVNVEVIEKRKDFMTRNYIVKIQKLILLDYFVNAL